MKVHGTSTLFGVFVLSICHSVHALWPMPRNLQTGTTLVKLAPTFDIQVQGISQVPQDLLDAISRTKTRLHSDKHQRLVVGRGATDKTALTHAPSLSKLTLSVSGSKSLQSIMHETTKDIESRSEGYSLSLPSSNSGTATITADSSLGLLRGLTTFEQLFYDDGTGVSYTYQAPVTIKNDSPAYVRSHISLCTSLFSDKSLLK